MQLFEAEARARWSPEGNTRGRLVVAFPSSIFDEEGFYGGHLVDVLDRYVATNPQDPAICVVLDEAKEPELEGRVDLIDYIGGFVTFGALGRPSHFEIIKREMYNSKPSFVGGVMREEYFDDTMTSLIAQNACRGWDGQLVELQLNDFVFSVHALSQHSSC